MHGIAWLIKKLLHEQLAFVLPLVVEKRDCFLVRGNYPMQVEMYSPQELCVARRLGGRDTIRRPASRKAPSGEARTEGLSLP